MEASFAGRNGGQAASLQAIVDELSADQSGVDRGRPVVLQLQKEACLGGCRGSEGFGGRQGVE